MIIPPVPIFPIVNESGVMTPEVQTWTALVSNPILAGTGSPEAVVKATQQTLYMDDAGTAGSILYIKRDADIGGDTSQGWILV